MAQAVNNRKEEEEEDRNLYELRVLRFIGKHSSGQYKDTRRYAAPGMVKMIMRGSVKGEEVLVAAVERAILCGQLHKEK